MKYKVKYKVIKQFPTVKEGDIFTVELGWSWLHIINFSAHKNSHLDCNEEILDELLNDGWIEKIKDEKIITIRGKKWSVDTIVEALKKHAQ